MNAKMNMPVDTSLRDVEAQAEDTLKMALRLGRKTFFIYAGLLGMAYDKAMALLTNSMNLVDKAEHRGETIVQDAGKRVDAWREGANDKVAHWRGDVEQRVQAVGTELSENVKTAEKKVEQKAEKVMERLGLAGENAAAEPMTIEITEMVVMEPELTEPLAGYDEMTAKEVIERLPELGEDVMRLVSEYEAANKNRVTVLQAIEERLTRMEPVMA